MTELQRQQEYFFGVGQRAYGYKLVGATDSQIKNYIQFCINGVRNVSDNTAKKAAREGWKCARDLGCGLVDRINYDIETGQKPELATWHACLNGGQPLVH